MSYRKQGLAYLQKRSWVEGFDCERTRIRDVHESYKKYDFDSCSTRGLGILELK